MIEILLMFGTMYLGYRVTRKPGEKFFYDNNQFKNGKK